MRTLVRWFLLLALPLSAGETVKLVHNLPSDPPLSPITEALEIKKIGLAYNDLNNDNYTSYFVFWNRPAWVKRKALRRLPKEKAILFLWESPADDKSLYSRKYLRHFKKIYTWNDDLVDYKRFFKFYIPALKPMIADRLGFTERKFLTAIFAWKKSKDPLQLYPEWEKAVAFFETQEGFEFYGSGWEGHAAYRGPATNDVLKNHKFALCYENMQGVSGYITEKIFDCFAAGTIPIYWGAANIEKYIPEGCYIDRRRFASDAALLAFLQTIDADAYETYLENIRQFLESEAAQRFSQKMFTTIFLEAVHFP